MTTSPRATSPRPPAGSTAPGVLFLVTSSQQLDAARAVAAHLPGAAHLVDPYSGVAAPLDRVERIDRPVGRFPTPRAMAVARRTARRALRLTGGAPPVLVVGQDEGTLERIVIAEARRAGARLAILPDGIRTTERLEPHSAHPLFMRAVAVADRILVIAGVLAGRRFDFGSSAPDLVVSWGPGWDRSLRGRAPGARIESCGSPNADALAALGPPPGAGHVLVCSQPLMLAETAAPPAETAAWYAWLSSMAAPDPRVRIRLHPVERSPRYRLPPALAHLADAAPVPLTDDLAWADVVVAPYSSVLAEAVGAGRVAMSAGGIGVWGEHAAIELLRDPRVPDVDFRRGAGVEDILALAGPAARELTGLRADYLANVGTAAPRVAEAILRLARDGWGPAAG